MNEEKKRLIDMDEFEVEQRRRKKETTNQILRFFGLIFVVIIFLVTFSVLTPLTAFAGIFGTKASDAWLNGMPQVFDEGIYHAVIGSSTAAATFIMTLVQLGLMIGLVLLISIYIRDLVIVVKSFFKFGRDVAKEIGVGLNEGLSEADIMRKSGSLFDDKPKKEKKEKPEKSDDTKRKFFKSKEEKAAELLATLDKEPVVEAKPEPVKKAEPEFSDEELNKMLTDPSYAKRELFDNKQTNK